MNGKAHATASIILAVPCAIAAGALADPMAGVGAGLGCLAGIALTPDLDQESISRNEWQIVKCTLGLGFLWVLFWYPYALAHKHRGMSHWPILGTLVRVAYLALPALVLALVLGIDLGAIPEAARWVAVWVFCGLVVSDGAHFLMDLLSTLLDLSTHR